MSQAVNYDELCLQAKGLLEGESDLIANLANISALLWMVMEDINWSGFYLYKQDQLVLGPFQGKPACIRIPMGQGVCGTAAASGEIQVVDDVHQFDGHIACDGASNSEIVLPFYHQEQLIGVLDIDSPSVGRFSQHDADGLKRLVTILEASLS